MPPVGRRLQSAAMPMAGGVTLIRLLIQAGRVDEARRMATRLDGSIISAAAGALAEAYAGIGRFEAAEAVLPSAPRGEVEYEILLAMARAASNRRDAATQPEPSQEAPHREA